MDELSREACKVANKVFLSMRYEETIDRRNEAGQMVQEAFMSTCELLDQLNPEEIRAWFDQFYKVFCVSKRMLIDDSHAWSEFLGSQCDLLQNVGLQQKTIVSIGDELAQWERRVVSFDELADGLDGLVSLVTDHSHRLGDAIEQQAGAKSKSVRLTTLFAHAVCGLTIVLVAINRSTEIGDPRDENCAALASFGATLTISAVSKLYRACGLNYLKT